MNSNISPITYAQQGMYIDCVLDPESLRYNCPIACTFPKGIKAEAVRDAAKAALECHPSFFSHFEDRDGDIVQVFDVGLTSLLAIRLSVQVNQKMNANLAVRDILHYPTVKELAGRLEEIDKMNA